MLTARRSPIETVLTAVVAALRNSTGVTALVGSTGIYNSVPQTARLPYLEVTSPTDTPQDTFGRFGASILIDVKTISEAAGDQEASRITNQVLRALQFATLNTTGHTALGVTWESSTRFADVVNGVMTRYHVASFRVWTEQSTTN